MLWFFCGFIASEEGLTSTLSVFDSTATKFTLKLNKFFRELKLFTQPLHPQSGEEIMSEFSFFPLYLYV